MFMLNRQGGDIYYSQTNVGGDILY